MSYVVIPSTLLNTNKKEVLRMVKKGMTLSVRNTKTNVELFIISPPTEFLTPKRSVVDLTGIYSGNIFDLTDEDKKNPYEISQQAAEKYNTEPVARYRN
jgi:hypothetical protein